MPPARLLLCIDDPARRRGLAAALGACGDVAVVGDCPAGEAGLRAAAARQPDLILVEAGRPGLDGAKLVGRLRAAVPRATVLAVAAPGDRPRSAVARSLVADRYVDPGRPTATVVGALLELARERRGGRIAS